VIILLKMPRESDSSMFLWMLIFSWFFVLILKDDKSSHNKDWLKPEIDCFNITSRDVCLDQTLSCECMWCMVHDGNQVHAQCGRNPHGLFWPEQCEPVGVCVERYSLRRELALLCFIVPTIVILQLGMFYYHWLSTTRYEATDKHLSPYWKYRYWTLIPTLLLTIYFINRMTYFVYAFTN
jgi:hypothetical protein